MEFKHFSLFAVALAVLMADLQPAHAQFSAERRAYVESIAVPDHPDRLYKTGEVASLRLEAYAGGVPVDGIWVKFRSGDELMAPEIVDSMRFENGVDIFLSVPAPSPASRQ